MSETMNLLKKHFPKNNVRYISVLENIETTTGMDIRIAMTGLINEQYAVDISHKVKAAKQTKAKHGDFINSVEPYGYIKDAQNKNHLVIDEAADKTVIWIFTMFAQGVSARAIADMLNNQKVDPPRVHYYKRVGKPNPFKSESGKWGERTITQMLKKQVYIGHMVQGTRRNISPLLKVRAVVPKDQWICVENTHEPLIDMALWDAVQKLLAKNERHGRTGSCKTAEGDISLFKGVVKCGDCGARMNRTVNHGATKSYPKYRCSTYANSGAAACSYNAISEEELSRVVLNDIRKVTEELIEDEAGLLSKIQKLNKSIMEADELTLRKQKAMLENEIATIDTSCKRLMDERIAGTVTDDMMKRMMGLYERDIQQKEERLKQLKSSLAQATAVESESQHLLSSIKKHVHIQELDRAVVTELIDKIVVSKVFEQGGQKVRDVEIHYNFAGPM